MADAVTVIFLFLSTPSARRATCSTSSHHQRQGISIHALREEGDEVILNHCWFYHYFYPRPPRGGRPWANGSEPVK